MLLVLFVSTFAPPPHPPSPSPAPPRPGPARPPDRRDQGSCHPGPHRHLIASLDNYPDS